MPDLVKSSEHVTLADAEAVNKELKVATSIQKRREYALNTPSRIRAEVGKYALRYDTQGARKRFSSKYPQYEFKRSNRREPESREGQFTKVGRPNKVND